MSVRKRISSLFTPGSNQDPRGDANVNRSLSPANRDTRRPTPPTLVTPQLSEPAVTSPSSATLAPPSPFSEPVSPARSRDASPFSLERSRRLFRRSRIDPEEDALGMPQFWYLTSKSREPYDMSKLATLQQVCALFPFYRIRKLTFPRSPSCGMKTVTPWSTSRPRWAAATLRSRSILPSTHLRRRSRSLPMTFDIAQPCVRSLSIRPWPS